MKLDRNINDNKLGKYALLKLRKLDEFRNGTFQELAPKIAEAIRTLDKAGILDWGQAGTEAEFFVMRLKDKHARLALHAYAESANADDPEYAGEIGEMASRAGVHSPWCKAPD
jgi:hypothetical protein